MTDFPFETIEEKIGYHFANREHLYTAFVHSSYAKEHNIPDNERMEFFGDAVLEAISTEYLDHLYPNKDAGELSKARAFVVSASGLKMAVEKMEIMPYLILAGGSYNVKKMSSKLEANLFEALLCAVYFDGGIAVAKEFALRWLKPYLDHIDDYMLSDYKTLLQEYCQRERISVKYIELSKKGPDNKPTFRCAVLLNGKEKAVGEGTTIKAAEREAAKIAYLDIQK
jgi:ribonuclease-3